MVKIIHYCWFGGNPKSELILKCIESWKKYCPDYKIIEWNEDNFDINCCEYVKEAYEAKKWAFVSDYCRFHVLYNQGGIYLDTDVELIKNLDGLSDCFVGFESNHRVASGLIRAANKGDRICKLMLESYSNDHFLNPDGSYNLMTVCDRETEILSNLGLKKNNSLQVVCNTTIYPKDYFCPYDFSTCQTNITNNTRSIHLYAGTWYSPQEDFAQKLRKKLNRFIPNSIAAKIAYVIALLKFKGFIKTLRIILKKIKKR